ncbi:MAG: hypothetical protein E7172_04760 [Firmicutes bacterium]|nr:hypothetical protein [Bacillota bacterium]
MHYTLRKDFGNFIINYYFENNHFKKAILYLDNQPTILFENDPIITKLNENNYIIEDKDFLKNYVHLINNSQLVLCYLTNQNNTFIFDDHLLEKDLIILKTNNYYLYSLKEQQIISDAFHFMQDNVENILIRLFYLHDTFTGHLDYNGHLIDGELHSKVLNEYFNINNISKIEKRVKKLYHKKLLEEYYDWEYSRSLKQKK